MVRSGQAGVLLLRRGEGGGRGGVSCSRSLVVPVLVAGVPETRQCRRRSRDPEQHKQGGIEPSEVKWV